MKKKVTYLKLMITQKNSQDFSVHIYTKKSRFLKAFSQYNLIKKDYNQYSL